MENTIENTIQTFCTIECNEHSIVQLESFLRANFFNGKNKNCSESIRQKLWQVFQRFESHINDERLSKLRMQVSCFSNKQKNKQSASTKRPRHSEHSEYSKGFVPYDGPDDIDRYQGHGEWDSGSGYFLQD